MSTDESARPGVRAGTGANCNIQLAGGTPSDGSDLVEPQTSTHRRSVQVPRGRR